MARLLIDTLYSYRAQSKYLLHEFVVMPEHIHLLITPALGLTIERAMQFIKGGYSYRVGKELVSERKYGSEDSRTTAYEMKKTSCGIVTTYVRIPLSGT